MYFRFFRNVIHNAVEQYQFNQSCNQAMSSLKAGDKTAALKQMQVLLEKQPENVYLRHQLLKIVPDIKLPDVKAPSQRVHI